MFSENLADCPLAHEAGVILFLETSDDPLRPRQGGSMWEAQRPRYNDGSNWAGFERDWLYSDCSLGDVGAEDMLLVEK